MKLLIRFSGEMSIKSPRVRARFQKQLQRNITHALACSIQPNWHRLCLETSEEQEVDALGRVAGVSSYSPLDMTCYPSLESIVDRGYAFYHGHVKGKSFAIRAKRRFKHAFTSKQLENSLGAKLLPHAKEVNLNKPEIVINIEVEKDSALFFCKTYRGIGGLPLGTGGEVVTLISGGFDSVVAAFLLYKRGVKQNYVFCNLPADYAYEASVMQVLSNLCQNYAYGYRPKIFCVDFLPVIRNLRLSLAPKYWQVILKRLLYRSAQSIAFAYGGQAIVTGESIGQVSSQTLSNLASIEQAVKLPVLRPLLGFNKEEIIAIAKEIGTYELSAPIQEYCQLSKARPVTNLSLASANSLEDKLDLGLLDRQLSQSKPQSLDDISAYESPDRYVLQGGIASDAVVIDCRTEEEFQRQHHPRAEHICYERLLSSCHKLDKSLCYVIYCEAGMQSVAVARRMQEFGFRAYSAPIKKVFSNA